MTLRTTRRAVSALILAMLTTGCALGNLANVVPKPTASTDVTNPAVNQPLEPLNGVEFKPITAEASKYLSANGASLSVGSNSAGGAVTTGATASVAKGASAEMAPAAAPAPMAAAADVAPHDAGVSTGSSGAFGQVGGAFSGNVWGYYGYNYYFGGFGDSQQMSLVSLQQAALPGSSAGFADIVANTAAPLVKAWAKDARLIHSGALLDANGKLVVPSADPNSRDTGLAGALNGWSQNGWTLTYASSSRLEVMTFVVTAATTEVLRMRWSPLNLAPERVLTDSGSAIQKLTAAIQDKTFASQEEKTGNDYFLNFPFDQPKTGEYDGDYQRTEVVYQVPANAQWNVDLQQIMGHLVWSLNYYTPYDGTEGGIGIGVGIAKPLPAMAVDDAMTTTNQAPCPTPVQTEVPGWFNNSAQGMVDAENGTVIRFTRPTRSYYKNQVQPQVCVGPSLPPDVKPSPTDTPTPTPADTPVPSPTPTASQQ